MILSRMPSIAGWPTNLRDMEDIRRDMERLFNMATSSGTSRSAGVYPAINVSEDAESVFVRAELPGIDTADLDVSMENRTLTISGERKKSEDSDSVSYHRREREWGAFRRSLTLNTPVDAEKVQARYEHGILTVVLPKAPEARPRQIAIQAGS